jgi:hypothetical protein
VISHCPGTKNAALAFLECRSDANTISGFGTQIFMGPLWLVLISLGGLCLKDLSEVLESLKPFEKNLGFV